jgi:anti-repressor protein
LSELQIFKNEEFGEVRILERNGLPWFVAKDVCDVLKHTNSRMALSRLDPDEKDVSKVYTLGGDQELNIVNEYGLFNLILASKLPTAHKFKRWVTHEVLPSIRKNGGYIANQENLSETEILANAVLVAKNVIENQKKQLAEMKPKADFFDQVADSKTAVAIGDVANVLGIKGIGRNKLFEILRDKKVLKEDNQPYRQFIDNGYFRVIEQKYQKNGETVINFKTLVYQRGIDYIRKIVA